MATNAVVDDDGRFSTMMREYLEAAGHAVWLAEGPQAFIERARKSLPDLIVLDINMPGGGAPAVMRFLKGNAATQSLPVIISSSVPLAKQRKMFGAIEGIRFLEKPVDFPSLLQYIKELTPA